MFLPEKSLFSLDFLLLSDRTLKCRYLFNFVNTPLLS